MFLQQRMMTCTVGQLKKFRQIGSFSYILRSPRLGFYSCHLQGCRPFSHRHGPPEHGHDPRLEDLGQVIEDEYAVIRERYGTHRPSSLFENLA